MTLFDSERNKIDFQPAALDGLRLPSSIADASNLPDVDPPLLTSLKLGSRVVNTSLAPQTITLDFGVTDHRSGVDFAPQASCPCRLLGLALTSPSGNQRVDTWHSTFTQISGNALQGTWATTVTFPRYAEAGTWSLDVYLRDRNYNNRQMLRADFERAGFPSGPDVIRSSYVPDGTVESTGGTIEDTVFGSRASLTIPTGALPARRTISIDVLLTPPTNSLVPQGFSYPATRFVNLNLIPHPTAPIGSPGYTLTIPLGNPMAPGERLKLFRLDPVSGALIDAVGISAGGVHGTVDPGGQSATFTGIASFSTVVGATFFRPEARRLER